MLKIAEIRKYIVSKNCVCYKVSLIKLKLLYMRKCMRIGEVIVSQKKTPTVIFLLRSRAHISPEASSSKLR